MDKVRGFSSRTIEAPGYHLHPKWDLVHTRHLLHQRNKARSFSLNLAPMVDMFSILVIYLIMNFSSTGEAFFMSKEIKIPQATKGRPMESYPLISVVGERVMIDAPESSGGESVYIEEKNDGINQRLREKLRQMKAIDIQVHGEKNFSGQVNLQADESTDVEEVKKVMRLLTEEGWKTINFIFEPNSNLEI